jgi:hypothetical protein
VLKERQRRGRGKARQKRVQRTQADPMREEETSELRRPDVVEVPATVAVEEPQEQSARQVEEGRDDSLSGLTPQRGNEDVATFVPAHEDREAGSNRQRAKISHSNPRTRVKIRKKQPTPPQAQSLQESPPGMDLRPNPRPKQRSAIELGI